MEAVPDLARAGLLHLVLCALSEAAARPATAQDIGKVLGNA
jgi:hypothetical protein